MADSYPIQIVKIAQKDYVKPKRSGGPPKVFGKVTDSLRDQFTSQVIEVQNYYKESFKAWPHIPHIIKVELKKEAIAKSHRPTSLLSSANCSIVGDYGFGKLLVKANSDSLSALAMLLRNGDTKEKISNISTLKQISPLKSEEKLYLPPERLDSLILQEKFLRINVFNLRDKHSNHSMKKSFEEMLRKLGLTDFQLLNHSSNQFFYKIKVKNIDDVRNLASFPSLRNISAFPEYKILKTSHTALGDIHEGLFPPPLDGKDYPLVGVIDSGVKKNNKYLKDWVTGNQQRIIDDETDFEHGTFVAGLIANGNKLNRSDYRFPDVQAKIIDICALSSKYGIEEDDLIDVIEDALKAYPDVRIWNLSLGASQPTNEDSFSVLTIYLDELQDKYDVLFVISSGNYQDIPLRSWPSNIPHNNDRISSPGDSTRAICVGSIAHKDTPVSAVKAEQPSPFSRRGPGPCFIPKPEVVHYGGNCDPYGNYAQTGILSISAEGKHAENIGTSFSTPLVSCVASQYTQLIKPTISKELIKALVIHSSVLNSPLRSAKDIKYYGFGMPQNPYAFLNGNSSIGTLVFEGELYDSLILNRYPFPLPSCLKKNEKFSGEIIMTLVYSPPTDPSFLAEYCRTNIEVSLGTYDDNKQKIKIPIDPKDINKLYESDQIEHGFKWSPVKVYRHKFPLGTQGNIWRLKLSLLRRSEVENEEDHIPQKFVLVLSVRDPEEKAPVYNDMIKEMNKLAWDTQSLNIKPGIRIRT